MTERARHRVVLAPAAARELDRLPPGSAASVRGPILALGIEPRPHGTMRVRGTPFMRIRTGSMRIIYLVDDEAVEVAVLRVARRSESTYRRLR